MHRGTGDLEVTTINRSAALPQLVQKPQPFVLRLAVGDENPLGGPYAAEFGSIKRVTPRKSLSVDNGQVTVDRGAR